MSQREIVSLQFGNQANFLGSHFWNLQSARQLRSSTCSTSGEENNGDTSLKKVEISESLDRKVFFRTGQTEEGNATRSPRLLLFDSQDSLGPLRRDGYQYYQSIYRDPYQEGIVPVWGGAVECINYSDNVGGRGRSNSNSAASLPLGTYWSDYLTCPLHPKTVQPLKTVGGGHFQTFAEGSMLYREEGKSNAIEALDSIRFFLEECDSPQGFLCSIDVHSGFAGYSSHFITALRDDYRSKAFFGLGLLPVEDDYVTAGSASPRAIGRAQANRCLNVGMGVAELSENFDLWIPLTKPQNPPLHVLADHSASSIGPLNMQSRYHCGALWASALDTLMLPLQMRKGTYQNLAENGSASKTLWRLRDLTQGLKPRPALRVASLSIAIPLQLPHSATERFSAAGIQAYCPLSTTVNQLKSLIAKPFPHQPLHSAANPFMIPLSPVQATTTSLTTVSHSATSATTDDMSMEPFAHAAVVRGVDASGGMGAGAGEALSAALRRSSRCRAAGVAAFGSNFALHAPVGFSFIPTIEHNKDFGHSVVDMRSAMRSDDRIHGASAFSSEVSKRATTNELSGISVRTSKYLSENKEALSTEALETAMAVRVALSSSGTVSAAAVESAAAAAAAACMAQQKRQKEESLMSRGEISLEGSTNSTRGLPTKCPALVYAHNSRALLPFLRRVEEGFRTNGARTAYRKYEAMGFDEDDYIDKREYLTMLADSYSD